MNCFPLFLSFVVLLFSMQGNFQASIPVAIICNDGDCQSCSLSSSIIGPSGACARPSFPLNSVHQRFTSYQCLSGTEIAFYSDACQTQIFSSNGTVCVYDSVSNKDLSISCNQTITLKPSSSPIKATPDPPRKLPLRNPDQDVVFCRNR